MLRQKMHEILARVNGSVVINDRLNNIEISVSQLRTSLSRLEDNTKTNSIETTGLLRKTSADIKAINKQINSEEIYRIRGRKNQGAVFVLSSHDWGNLGDLAIGYSQQALLEAIFPKREVFIVSRFTLLSNWQRLKGMIRPDDLLTIIGGGNMGDVWISEERARRKIVEAFPKNAIISFPQSIKFDDQQELLKSAQVYNAHEKIMIAVRDDASYALAKEYFSKATIFRTEDIVMSYEFPTAHQSTEDRVVYVTRNDKEKKDVPALNNIHMLIDSRYKTYSTDTVINNLEFSGHNFGSIELYLKIDEIQASRLVVTDRLHGAIFALLAGRPVIVVDNSYGKIRGALKNISSKFGDRILFSDDEASNVSIGDIERMYDLPEADEKQKPATLLKEEIRKFKEAIQEFVD